MPKVPAYTLSWSPTTAAFELYQTHDQRVLSIVPDSPEWFAWLDQVSSFAFCGKSGHYTARKETKQRGDRYWYAYLASGEQLTKKYLGKSADLTLVRLEHIAGELSANQAAIVQLRQTASLPPAQSETQVSTPVSLAATSAEDEVEMAPPALAPQRHPLSPLLATKLRAPRPRIHLVHRAHLVKHLERGAESALTLASVPARFGKMPLFAQWVAESAMPVAWLSLEAEDNDPTRFLAYLIAALQTLDAEIGTRHWRCYIPCSSHRQRPCWLCSPMTSSNVGEAMLSSCWMTTTSSPLTPFSTEWHFS